MPPPAESMKIGGVEFKHRASGASKELEAFQTRGYYYSPNVNRTGQEYRVFTPTGEVPDQYLILDTATGNNLMVTKVEELDFAFEGLLKYYDRDRKPVHVGIGEQ